MIDEQHILLDLREGERMFPIFRIQVKWSEAVPSGAEEHIHRVGEPAMPAGRFWNGTSWDTMERARRSGFDIAAEIERTWWPKCVANKKPLEAADLSVAVTPLGKDVWCPGWFSHWTFDVGLSDGDVLESFER
jgi:hypothetical protein